MAKWKIGTPIDAKPCRVCRSGNVYLWTDTGTQDFFIECEACGSDGPTDTAFGAVDRWNKGELDEEDDPSASD